MAETERPQIYLITPAEVELSSFPDLLGRMLDMTEVACVRMALSTRDEDRLSRTGDALREVAHARDVALVIAEHGLMVDRLGLDGVHLPDGARSVRKWRKELGDDAIVGAFCGASRHDGINRPAKPVRTMSLSARSARRRWAMAQWLRQSCSNGGPR